MRTLSQVLAAAFCSLPATCAFASQGPGTQNGTATGLEQGLLIGAIVVAAGIGLALRLTHR